MFETPAKDRTEAAERLTSIRATRAEQVLRMRHCSHCGRRHGEGILGFAEGSWYSPLDGYYGPTGKRLTQVEIHRLTHRPPGKQSFAIKFAPVMVKVDKKTGLCDRCTARVEGLK